MYCYRAMHYSAKRAARSCDRMSSVCPSVCPTVTFYYGLWSHRLEIWKTNCTNTRVLNRGRLGVKPPKNFNPDAQISRRGRHNVQIKRPLFVYNELRIDVRIFECFLSPKLVQYSGGHNYRITCSQYGLRKHLPTRSTDLKQTDSHQFLCLLLLIL